MNPNISATVDYTPKFEVDTTNKITNWGGETPEQQEDAEKKLLEKMKTRFEKYEGDCQKNWERAKLNRKYTTNNFDGYDDPNLLPGETPMYVPKIRANMETVIPFATQKSPEPDIRVFARNGSVAKSKALKVQNLTSDYLKQFWEIDGHMQNVMEKALRIYYCQAYMCLKYLWNADLKRPEVYAVPIGNLVFPINDVKDPKKMPWMAEKISNSYSDLKKKYFTLFDEDGNETGVDEARINEFELRYTDGKLTDDSKIDYVEYWERGFVAWSYKFEFLFGREENPNYNFDDQPNHHEVPCIPYVMDNAYSYGDRIADDATPVESSKSMADAINKTKRQLDLNQDDANGQAVINGDYVSDEDADKFDRSRQNKIIAKSRTGEPVQIGNVLTYVSGRGMGAETVRNLEHSETVVDGEFATHEAMRGEQKFAQQTATGTQVVKNSDQDKNGTMTRMIERSSQEVFDGIIQLLYVYGDEGVELYSEEEDLIVQQIISKQTLSQFKLKVLVKDGSTVPRNPAVLKAEIVDLASQGKASLLDMYRDLGYDDYQGRAKRAIMEKDPSMLMTLYGMDGNIDTFNTEAVMHIEGLISGEMQPQELYQMPDLKLFKAHLKTHTDWLAGKEVNDDLPMFVSLAPQTQMRIQMHVQLELQAFEQLQKQELMNTLMAQKQAAVQQAGSGLGLPPQTQQTPLQQPPQTNVVPPGVSALTGNTEATPVEATQQMLQQ